MDANVIDRRWHSPWVRPALRALVGLLCLLLGNPVLAQLPGPESPPLPKPRRLPRETKPAFSVAEVLRDVDRPSEVEMGDADWWTPHVRQPLGHTRERMPISIDALAQLALLHSAQLRAYEMIPEIRRSAVTEADARFDWHAYLDSLWEDTSEPVGNRLTVGGSGTRFTDEKLGVTAGLRRKTTRGGQFEVNQQFGHQDNNSTFFVPGNQGTARLQVSLTQPLLRGRGRVYNTSLTVLAQIDLRIARDEFERQLESHLLEVARAYWALYLERGGLAQRVKLYRETHHLVTQLEARQHIDAGATQLTSARAALAARASDLIRRRAAVANAETRIRALLHAPEPNRAGGVELLPLDDPIREPLVFDLAESVETALQHRSEVAAAVKQLRAGSVRLHVAKHEMLPILNAVTSVYVSGLRGRSQVGQAWVDQFGRGAPSYTTGLQLEVPIWNRTAAARLHRRRTELRQLEAQYQSALESVRSEVEIAVREVHTAYADMRAKRVAVLAAATELAALDSRWRAWTDVQRSGALALEALLRAQERAAETEFALLEAQLTYNLALTHRKRALGIVVEMEHGSPAVSLRTE